MKTTKLHTPSIVLEWETVADGGVDRAERGLREVNRQLAELCKEMAEPAEVIISYEERTVSSRELRAILDLAAGPDGWACPVLLVPVPDGTHYYEKKNVGGRASKNSIIVFVDTDLIPDLNWLRNILRAFDDWSISVLLGATHLDHVTTYEMAVALIWIFDPATEGRGIQPLRRYSSNNLAFRRELFLKFPFPEHPTYRGQCGDLGETLLRMGIPMAEHTDARASHPPPPLRGFVHRAWSAGQDEQFYANQRTETTYKSALRQWWRDYGVVARRIRERRKLLRPTPAAERLGWLLGWAYYGIKAAGYLSKVHQTTERTPTEHVRRGA
jgi:hypothetical protein